MTIDYATSATDAGVYRRAAPPGHRLIAALMLGAALMLTAALMLAVAPPASGAGDAPAPATPPATKPAPAATATTQPATTAPPTGRRMTPADLRETFTKCIKTLNKAADATEGHDAGRVSMLLRRADELIVEFDAGAGIDEFVAALAASRAAASAGNFEAAESALRHGRDILRALADYTVARPTEVAYRSALGALGDRNAADFAAAVGRLEATVQAPYLAAQLRTAREAIARGRAAMVRNDMKTGRREVVAARVALGRMDYAASLGQARHGLLLAAELLRDGSFLTAREQARQAIHSIRDALDRAPEPDVETLNTAEATVSDVWRRLTKPDPSDPDKLNAAADQIETLRQHLR